MSGEEYGRKLHARCGHPVAGARRVSDTTGVLYE
jgi:hypothetical protein